jgi:paraquat-inducible protein B
METTTKPAAGHREAKRRHGSLLTQPLWLCPLVSIALAVLLLWLSNSALLKTMRLGRA